MRCGLLFSLPSDAVDPEELTLSRGVAGGDATPSDDPEPKPGDRPGCVGMEKGCFAGISMCVGGCSRAASLPLADSLRDMIGGVTPPGGDGEVELFRDMDWALAKLNGRGMAESSGLKMT